MNKPSGIPSQKDITDDTSILDLAEIYCKRKLFLVHRLDRPVSGLMLLGKTKSFLQAFSKAQKEQKMEKVYYTLCAKTEIEREGILKNDLFRDAKSKKAILQKTEKSHPVELAYKIIGELDNYFVIEVKISNGRFHQIRAQLGAIGLHIKGDVKYGARRANKDRSIDLHAYSLKIHSDIPSDVLYLTASIPNQDPIWKAALQYIK